VQGFGRKPRRKRKLGRPRRRWEDVIGTDLGGDWLCGVEWIQLAHVKDLVSAMMKLRVR
jgi:hypothetical protein